MIHEVEEEEEDIAESVLPPEIVESAIPLELNQLFPWHRPRKQFIRKFQWQHHANRLIGHLYQTNSLPHNQSGDHELRYLTLPGTDYLDVRMLSECCRDAGCVLTSTGFLAAETGNPHKARAEIRQEALIKAGYISDRSHTIWRRLEEVSSAGSNAYSDIQRRGPFHIINIDACGSPAPANADHAQRMIDAIHRIIELQLSMQRSRWLLFLTVDIRNDTIDTETLQNLTQAIRQNAAESTEFRAEAEALFAVTENRPQDLNEGITAATGSEGMPFIRLFSLGMAKWFLHLVAERRWNMKMHNSFCYSTTPSWDDRPTMPCLAFEFLPPPPGIQDRFAVSRAPAVQASNDLNDPSLRALRKVAEMEDLDIRVGSNNELRSELIDETCTFLAEAGYSAAALAGLDEFR